MLIERFGADRVLVRFFDQLKTSPGDLMAEICEFAELDPQIYSDYVYRVENQTRIHRSATLRDVAGTLNARLEPLLNRFHSLRRAARGMYDLVNVPRGKDVSIPDASRQALENFCAPWNAELADWIETTYPGSDFPGWRTEAHDHAGNAAIADDEVGAEADRHDRRVLR